MIGRYVDALEGIDGPTVALELTEELSIAECEDLLRDIRPYGSNRAVALILGAMLLQFHDVFATVEKDDENGCVLGVYLEDDRYFVGRARFDGQPFGDVKRAYGLEAEEGSHSTMTTYSSIYV